MTSAETGNGPSLKGEIYMPINTMAFILGGLLVAVALLGGGIEVKELKIPSVGKFSRILCSIVGAGFIALAIYLSPRGGEAPKSAGDTPSAAPQPVKTESGEQAEWLTAAQSQQLFDKQRQAGFYPYKIDGRCENGDDQFHAMWKSLPLGANFFSHRAMTKDVYERRNQDYVSKGFSLEYLNSYKDCSGQDRYQAVWLKTN